MPKIGWIGFVFGFIALLIAGTGVGMLTGTMGFPAFAQDGSGDVNDPVQKDDEGPSNPRLGF